MLLGNFSPSFSRRDGLIHTTLRVMLKYIPASRMMDQVMLIQEDFVGGDKCWYSCTQLGKLCKLIDLVISRSLPEVVWGFLYDFMQVQPSQCLLILLPFSFQEHIIQHRKKILHPYLFILHSPVLTGIDMILIILAVLRIRCQTLIQQWHAAMMLRHTPLSRFCPSPSPPQMSKLL